MVAARQAVSDAVTLWRAANLCVQNCSGFHLARGSLFNSLIPVNFNYLLWFFGWRV